MYKKGGKKSSKKKESWMEESKEVHFGNKPKKFKTGGLYSPAEVSANKKRVAELNAKQDGAHQTQVEKKTGGKSMEPGGGGRFAAMVSKLKGKGKSTESAKAIAASIGRKKYGKSRFQKMAAAGKKGLGGMSDSTGANEAGMDMMESMDPGKGARHAASIRKRQKKGTARARRNIGKCNRGEVCFD